MEPLSEEVLTFDNHKNECRCCFRSLIDSKIVNINKQIEEKFFLLTQLDVRKLLSSRKLRNVLSGNHFSSWRMKTSHHASASCATMTWKFSLTSGKTE